MVVEVDSRRPVEVSVDLGPFAPEQRLASHLVNAGDPSAPALTDVVFEITDGSDGAAPRPRVRVRVDDALASGLYTGVVIDCDTGHHLGSLTIRISG